MKFCLWCFKRWASYVSSLSGFRGFAQQNGEEEAKKLLSKMLERWQLVYPTSGKTSDLILFSDALRWWERREQTQDQCQLRFKPNIGWSYTRKSKIGWSYTRKSKTGWSYSRKSKIGWSFSRKSIIGWSYTRKSEIGWFYSRMSNTGWYYTRKSKPG